MLFRSEELSDIKTAVSEAVTNSIIHAYFYGREDEAGPGEGKIKIICKVSGCQLEVTVIDEGVGIENIEQAMEPLYTTRPELERSGMGFAFMEAFMDEVTVDSTPGIGTTISMSKKISKEVESYDDLDMVVGFD